MCAVMFPLSNPLPTPSAHVSKPSAQPHPLNPQAKGDMYIAVPNGVGWCFALLQILLRVFIPARPEYAAVGNRDDDLEGAAGNGGSGERKRMVEGRPLAD